MLEVLLGILLPLIGTALGAFMVFFMKKEINLKIESLLLGFAGGVMIAASVWSLIIPAIDHSVRVGVWAFFPALVGLIVGFFVMFMIEVCDGQCGVQVASSKMMFAIVIHNIPEGFAVGVALAGAYFGKVELTLMAALALSIGIAVQNIPEGAIVSMPLKQKGTTKTKAFFVGTLSGVVEPICAVFAFFLSGFIGELLPYVLAFAGAAMIFVVVYEIIPEFHSKNAWLGMLGFVFGFLVMMVLDVALG